MKTYSDECLFCVKYAKEHGILSSNFEQVARLAMDLGVDFDMVRIEKSPKAKKTKQEIRDEFYRDVAADLRELWPMGNKEGRWPWRCDVLSLAKRLETLWKERRLPEDITKDDILYAAKVYLSQFKDDNTYMKICKYFVYKHVAEATNSKKAMVTCSSPLADYLEAHREERRLESELDSLLAETSVGEGELR